MITWWDKFLSYSFFISGLVQRGSIIRSCELSLGWVHHALLARGLWYLPGLDCMDWPCPVKSRTDPATFPGFSLKAEAWVYLSCSISAFMLFSLSSCSWIILRRSGDTYADCIRFFFGDGEKEVWKLFCGDSPRLAADTASMFCAIFLAVFFAFFWLFMLHAILLFTLA